MIYAVKTSKIDVIYVMMFNIFYNFADMVQKLLKSVLQCLNSILYSLKYALYLFGVP